METKTKIFGFKATHLQVQESSIMQGQHQMVNNSFNTSWGSSCHQKFRTGSTNEDCNSRVCEFYTEKIIYKKHSKSSISRNTAFLHNSLGKITQDQKHLSALSRRISIRIIIYLDDYVANGRDTLIFLLQYLGFVTNLKISVFHPVKQL